MSFGRERALYQLIGSKKAQIQTLRDHIKKSNRRTYFSFVINLIIRISSNPEENLGNFPVSFRRERALYQLIGSKKAQIQTLRGHIKKSNRRTYFSFVINLIIRISSNPEENLGKFPVSFRRERALYQLIGSKKAQIQTLRGHIKKSDRRTYFSFVINLITRVSSNPEEKFRKFPRVVWTGEGAFSAYR